MAEVPPASAPSRADLPVAAEALIRRFAALGLDAGPLRAAVARLGAPWRVTVFGRRSAGKSTLINAATGRVVAPTGLGGVSSAVAEIGDGDRILVDTPGIDDELGALTTLQPLLERTDAAVWVVDGLQPMTATERRVAAAALLPGTPLLVVVSRLDLADDADVRSVLDRVRALAAPFAPDRVVRVDLRAAWAAAQADPERRLPLIAPDPGRSPRRRAALASAVRAARSTWESEPIPDGPDQLRTRARGAWTDAVRKVEQRVAAAIADGTIDHKEGARRGLRSLAPGARDRALALLRGDGGLGPSVTAHPPRLPLPPESPHHTPLREVISAMSGQEGALRILRAEAASWLQEGELALLDWFDARAELGEARRAHDDTTRLLEALEAVAAGRW